MSSIFLRCSSCVPCEKLSLATSIPARAIRVSVSSFSLAGPIVHMIFVFLMWVFYGLTAVKVNRKRIKSGKEKRKD